MPDLPKGGSFLLERTDPQSIFTPEDFTEEHKMLARTVKGFVDDHILANIEELEAQKEGLIRELLMSAGELGLLGAEIPEAYDGFELDKISATLIAEGMGRAGSFAMTQGGQTGIGSLPIVFFGNEAQKQKYLPGIVTGEKIGAYALTEPGAGSDALAAKTKAVLSADGKYYILNGAKQFITNAGMADVFIVYAKIDGEKFSAFIVDGDSEGLSTGAEEKKMGIKGSSTRTLILEDVKVPVENLLFEIGRGHVVAFNILNMGRYKLAANSVGNAKFALEMAATYANERKQFNVPIAQFGLVKEKLAEMAVKIYAAESIVYRTGGLLDQMMGSLDTSGPDAGQIAAKGIEEYAVECSMNKVFATEVLGYVVDEGVQIHGGYGFISEYPIERLYRDARIYRIFEGTNEINRSLIPTTLVRRDTKGELTLREGISALDVRLAGDFPVRVKAEELVQAAKDIFLFTLGRGLDKYGEGLSKQQEILGRLADIAIGAFAMESAWLRAEKAAAKDGEAGAKLKTMMAKTYIYANISRLKTAAQEVLAALAEGQELEGLLAKLDKLTRYTPVNTVALRQEIAAAVSDAGKYVV
ncbi:acyl-CoA dehydrogenase family protein [Paradesulfitobacterium ferrireducens]|uniref:acyl-CoA dehydrogenase family protein n=1 Tax=Paradesulfitobacterium ferrireducens TaxID=2816476 RepID=UPI001A8D002B|nr:acyl-CoA dehydrogenase family protein [Paradesulfitobacterium ferrireducens]